MDLEDPAALDTECAAVDEGDTWVEGGWDGGTLGSGDCHLWLLFLLAPYI